jgi:hypothetical protein
MGNTEWTPLHYVTVNDCLKQAKVLIDFFNIYINVKDHSGFILLSLTNIHLSDAAGNYLLSNNASI